VLKENSDGDFINTLQKVYDGGGKLTFKNHFALTRGNYELISVVDENADQTPYTIKGKLIDLFDPEIPVLNEKQVKPGEQAFLYNIGSVKNPGTPQVLTAAARIYDEQRTGKSYAFIAKSPASTTNVMRVLLPAKPAEIKVTDAAGNALEAKTDWDAGSKTFFMSFENSPEGVQVKLSW
jgi:hypothetical protein